MAPASEVLIFVAFFATLFGIVYIIVVSRHRQRMAMIEKGMVPNIVAEKPGKLGKHGALRAGMLMAGIGLGLLVGWFADYVIFKEEWENDPMPYLIGVLLCGGGALIAYYRKVEKDQRNKG